MSKSLIKKIATICFWIGFSAATVVTVGFVESEHSKLRCKDVDISLNTAGENSFLTQAEVMKTIEQLLGDTVVGKPMKEISISLIRSRLEENQYVAHATVYATVDGILKVEISQRSPMVRVQNALGECFYLSDDGRMIPVSFLYTARVPFANGLITEKYDVARDLVPVIDGPPEISNRITTLQKIYMLGNALQQYPFLKAQIEQIFVDSEGDIELIPLAGEHTVILGNVDYLTEKLDKLTAFYQYGLKLKGYNTYKSINIKFKNQIICLKN